MITKADLAETEALLNEMSDPMPPTIKECVEAIANRCLQPVSVVARALLAQAKETGMEYQEVVRMHYATALSDIPEMVDKMMGKSVAFPKERFTKEELRWVVLYDTGQIVVFGKDGKQVGPLQVSPILLWAKHAEELGYDVDGLKIETRSGTTSTTLVLHRYPASESGLGWNYRVV